VLLSNACALMDYVIAAEAHSSAALTSGGAVDLLLRLYAAPRFPVKLLLTKTLKASLLPPQALRSSQRLAVPHLGARTADALAAALDAAVAALSRHAERDTLLDLPADELDAVMQVCAVVVRLRRPRRATACLAHARAPCRRPPRRRACSRSALTSRARPPRC